MRTFVLAIIVATSRLAAADPDDGAKSPPLALGLSIAGTAIGPSLVALAFENDSSGSRLHAEFAPILATGCASIVLGPSLGTVYAGHALSTGLGLRLAGAALFAAGIYSIYDPEGSEAAVAPLLVGAGMIVAGTVLDWRESVVASEAYNRAHHRALTIAPLAGPVTGVSVAGSF